MKSAAISAERVKAVLQYSPLTGEFVWLQRPPSDFSGEKSCKTWNTRFAGSKAGCINGDTGYEVIRIDGRRYSAHRLAWLWMTGRLPTGEVDHINGSRPDNRWVNLRDVTASVNRQNRRGALPGSSTGLLGVTPLKKTGRYQARIRVDGPTKYLGSFDTAEAAHAAYVEAKRRFHEGCTL